MPRHYLIDNWIFGEFLDSKSQTNIKNAHNFYFQAGQWLAIIYVLNGVDFHLENVLARKNKLILLDTETLFTNFSVYRNKNLSKNLATTGFIERKTKDSSLSALFGGNEKIISLLDLIIYHDNTDNIKISYKAISKLKIQNRIKINGKTCQPHSFAKDIIKGFDSAYLWFLNNKQNIFQSIDFTKKPIFSRVILRKTSFYAILIRHIAQPINFPLNKFTIKLKNVLIQNAKEFLVNNNEKIIKEEMKRILNLEVPVFWQNIKDRHLYFPDGKISNFFIKSAEENLIDKFNSLSIKDLENKKKQIGNYLFSHKNGIELKKIKNDL